MLENLTVSDAVDDSAMYRPLDEYNPCEAVNRDVLRLSEQFKLQGLYDLASQRIAMRLTT